MRAVLCEVPAFAAMAGFIAIAAVWLERVL